MTSENYFIISRKADKYTRHWNSKHAIQINHQPDATIFQFIILTFIYSSTCFGRSPAHHQELNDCSSSSSLWFCLERGDSSAIGRGRAGRPNHDQFVVL
jgi:hypothetical protein